jgi:trehalose 2-sulfotransferase
MSQEVGMPVRGYLICCIERTGDNLLAGALIQSGVAGRPHEYFNPLLQVSPRMRGILGDSTMVAGLPKILRAGTTSNGIFGAMLHWSHLRYLAMVLNDESRGSLPTSPGALLRFLADLPKLMPTAEFLDVLRARAVNRSQFPVAYKFFQPWLPDLRIIWLRRRNMVARAISQFRALHSKVGMRPTATPDDLTVAEPTPDFDLGQIHQLHVLGLFQEESWQWFFSELAITPHCVVYEDLIADYESTVRGVLDFLDLEGTVKSIEPATLLRQADSVSEEYELRYRKLSAEAAL